MAKLFLVIATAGFIFTGCSQKEVIVKEKVITTMVCEKIPGTVAVELKK